MFIKRVVAFFTAVLTVITSFLGLGNEKNNTLDSFRVTSYVVADYVQDINTNSLLLFIRTLLSLWLHLS